MVFKRNKNKKNRGSQAPALDAVSGATGLNHALIDEERPPPPPSSSKLITADTDVGDDGPPQPLHADGSGDSGSPSGTAALNIRSSAASMKGGSSRQLAESGAFNAPGSPSSPNRRKGKKKMLRRVKNWMRGKKGKRRMAPINTDLLQQEQERQDQEGQEPEEPYNDIGARGDVRRNRGNRGSLLVPVLSEPDAFQQIQNSQGPSSTSPRNFTRNPIRSQEILVQQFGSTGVIPENYVDGLIPSSVSRTTASDASIEREQQHSVWEKVISPSQQETPMSTPSRLRRAQTVVGTVNRPSRFPSRLMHNRRQRSADGQNGTRAPQSPGIAPINRHTSYIEQRRIERKSTDPDGTVHVIDGMPMESAHTTASFATSSTCGSYVAPQPLRSLTPPPTSTSYARAHAANLSRLHSNTTENGNDSRLGLAPGGNRKTLGPDIPATPTIPSVVLRQEKELNAFAPPQVNAVHRPPTPPPPPPPPLENTDDELSVASEVELTIKIERAEETLQMIQRTIQLQEDREHELEERIRETTLHAHARLSEGRKNPAVRYMKKVKFYQMEQERINQAISTMEEQVMSIESALNDIRISEAVLAGTTTMKELLSSSSHHKVNSKPTDDENPRMVNTTVAPAMIDEDTAEIQHKQVVNARRASIQSLDYALNRFNSSLSNIGLDNDDASAAPGRSPSTSGVGKRDFVQEMNAILSQPLGQSSSHLRNVSDDDLLQELNSSMPTRSMPTRMSRTPTAVEIVEILPLLEDADNGEDEDNNVVTSTTTAITTAAPMRAAAPASTASTSTSHAHARIDLTGTISAQVIHDENEFEP